MKGKTLVQFNLERRKYRRGYQLLCTSVWIDTKFLKSETDRAVRNLANGGNGLALSDHITISAKKSNL